MTQHNDVPTAAPQTVDELEDRLSQPSPGLVGDFRQLEGDLILLGAGGKMGPTLARMARRAAAEANRHGRVIAVSRFSDASARDALESAGVETIAGDLLDEPFVRSLPDAENVVYMAGMKFGATDNASLTWAMNTLLPARICERYAASRIAAFSTGNVYGLTPVTEGGAVETDPPNPQGEYAMSCLGRERVFEHYARMRGTRVSLLRLNYACELRYGVLVDLALKLWSDQPVDLSMSVANVIWQADANAMALRSLAHAASPPFVLNIAGPEQISVWRVCETLGERLGRSPQYTGEPGASAILSNGQLGHRLFGYPRVRVSLLIDWVAAWVARGGPTLGKPTKFEVRNGRF